MRPIARRLRLFASVAWLGGVAAVLFLAFWLIDFYVASRPSGGRGPFALLFDFDVETLQNELGSLAQVIVAVLGIAITVVSIVVQLAATRYTSRIADLFFHDKTNLFILGVFVIACIDAVWVTFAVGAGHVPRATVVMTLVVVTGSLLLLGPYFAYVFDFLDPQKVILRIGQHILDAATGKSGGGDLAARQAASSASLEHLGDVAVNAVAQKDKVIAAHAVAALRDVLVRYQEFKRGLPAGWFTLGPALRQDPDFIALSPDSVGSLEEGHAWLEWKVLRHFRSAFAESIAHLPEMAHVVAIDTRYVGESALAAGDRGVVAVTVKFFNTYMRIAINRHDVRASSNVLHQYRQLAERSLGGSVEGLAEEIARHFVYYSHLAHGQGQSFVTETAAHDLGALCERAFALRSPSHEALLRAFLDVDKEAETKAEEKALRGVRKAQVKLAVFYLAQGAEAHARQIQRDMAHEQRGRLASIRDELLRITSQDFWEVTDRGMNFDYLDAERRRQLDRFFAWFD
jgi:hypothetical protein